MNEEDRLGRPVPGWTPPRRPDFAVLEGRYAMVERLDPERHAAEIHAAMAGHDAVWDYMPYGPFADEAGYRDWMTSVASGEDPWFVAIRDRETGLARGVASYLRISPEAGSIEVGHIALAPALQKGRAATEALFMMMRWAFTAGYRRYEWKCNALNLASRRAAERFGLSFEGIFRQATVVKGRNRDTAWFACIDGEWPALESAYTAWLEPSNFDRNGRQRKRLSDLTRAILVARDPALAP